MAEKLENKVELLAEKAENLSFCRGIKLFYIRKSVNELLLQIGKCGFFEEYTCHSESHIDEMLKMIEWIIPKKTQEIMTPAEWLMLTLSVYFHDLGMVITKKEFNERSCNEQFLAYKSKIMDQEGDSEYIEYARRDPSEKFLYQEFVRENHAKRVNNWLSGKNKGEPATDSTVTEELHKMLSGLDKMFLSDLGMICESHHQDDIDNFSKYKVNVSYGSGQDEKVNLNYIAIILRVADLLHITRDRTPSITRKLVNVTNPVSVVEWEKQQAVRAVKPLPRRDADGNINNDLEKDTIEITAYFDNPDTAEAYFGLSAYIQYMQSELIRCKEIVEKAQKTEGTVDYSFPWCKVNEDQIIAEGFEKKKLSFTLAQEKILQLLVGHTLYNDSSVVVRELVQNGIDAVKLQRRIEKDKKTEQTDGRVDVFWNKGERQLSFVDNGTGMTIQDVENYLLKVGASKYRDSAFKKMYPGFNPISNFGIGILTCFMVANDIDILTKAEGQDEAILINLRRVTGSYLLRKIDRQYLDNEIQQHGTKVTLQVRSEIDISDLETTLNKWIVTTEVPVVLHEDSEEKRIGYDSLKEVISNYLNKVGMMVDGKNYDVLEETSGNVTVAYAVKRMKYLSDWDLIDVISDRHSQEEMPPTGICLEGIRINFATPGYDSPSFLAIANVKNSQYQTNVARSEIEFGSNQQLISEIYGIYGKFIESQMSKLVDSGYSVSWAMSEGYYLMQPLFSSSHRSKPVDKDLLVQQLATIKCLIIENDDRREAVSAKRVREEKELNLVECRITESAEHLLRELKCEAKLKDIISALQPEETPILSKKNVLCNYSRRNILHRYALEKKNVSFISVDRQHRCIYLTYRDEGETWDKFGIYTREYGNTSVFVPRTDFEIVGLEDEIGVKTNCGIFIKSDSEICRYIGRIIKQFYSESLDQYKRLISIFLSDVFNPRTLERSYKDTESYVHRFQYNSDDSYYDRLQSLVWSKIDMEEFSKIVLSQKHYLFSIDNWARE